MREKRRGKIRKPFIETENLILSLWEDNDEFLGYALWGNPTIASYWAKYLFTKDEIDSIIREEKRNFKTSKVCLFPVFTKIENAFVGVCGIHWYKDHYQFVDILLPYMCNTDYGVEAGEAVVKYAFDDLNISYLLAARCEDDDYCEFVYEKLGFEEIRNCFRTPNDIPYHTYILEKKVHTEDV